MKDYYVNANGDGLFASSSGWGLLKARAWELRTESVRLSESSNCQKMWSALEDICCRIRQTQPEKTELISSENAYSM